MPNGIMPQPKNRYTELTRPSSAEGIARWRRLTVTVFQITAKHDPMASANQTMMGEFVRPIASISITVTTSMMRSAVPGPSLATSGAASSPPATPPAAAPVSSKPYSAEERPSDSCASSTMVTSCSS